MKRKMNNRSKAAVALMLAALLSVGGASAFLTDAGSTDNEFTVGKVDFNIYEEAWDGELPDGSVVATPADALGINQAKHLSAGQVIPKNPALKNNSVNDAYVRIRVKVPAAEVVTVDTRGNMRNGGTARLTPLFSFVSNPGTGMRLTSDSPRVEPATPGNATPGNASPGNADRPGATAYYIYEYMYTGGGDTEIPLPAGHDIPPLFDDVTFANVADGQLEGAVEIVTVDFRAIQSAGFSGAAEAWQAYDRQTPSWRTSWRRGG